MTPPLLPLLLVALSPVPPETPPDPAPNPSADPALGEVVVSELDNGLTLIVAPMDSPGVVAWQVWMDVGSRDERAPGTTGTAHLFEHLMFTRGGGAPGARSNAWTSEDATTYHATLTPQLLPGWIASEAGRFLGLEIDEGALARESGAVLGEFRQGRADPEERLWESLYATAFPDHPYGHPVIGLEADVLAMPDALEAARDFQRAHYGASRARIVVAGDVDPAVVGQLVERHFGAWASGAARIDAPLPAPQAEPLRVEVSWPAPAATRLLVGWKVPGFDPWDPDAAALALASELLFSEIAPLYLDLYSQRRLVRALSPHPWTMSQPYLFTAAAELYDPADLPAVEARIAAAVAELASGVDPALLEAARDHYVKRQLMALDQPTAVAAALGAYALPGPGGEIDAGGLDAFLGACRAATPEDVARAAATWLVPERSTTATLLSAKEASP